MCEQLATRALRDAQGEQWRALASGAKAVPRPVVEFVEAKLMPLAQKESEHYNENGPLGDAIQEAVKVADIVNAWPSKLSALATKLGVTVEELVQSKDPMHIEVVTRPKVGDSQYSGEWSCMPEVVCQSCYCTIGRRS